MWNKQEGKLFLIRANKTSPFFYAHLPGILPGTAVTQKGMQSFQAFVGLLQPAMLSGCKEELSKGSVTLMST